MSLVSWINFGILNLATIWCWYFYILSVQPVARAEKFGENAWKTAKRHRAISGALMFVMIINIILWFWFPIPVFAWPVHPNHLISVLTGIILACIFTPIWFKGLKDAGRETMIPDKDQQLYGGIYRHIRHPQIVGEMPWWVIIPLVINSLFLVFWAIMMVILVSPLIIYYEEKDLMKRFGEAYHEYKRNTGAIIPKFWRKKEQ